VAALIAVEMNALISAACAAAVPASRKVTIASVRMKNPPIGPERMRWLLNRVFAE
jgi:hypothetical protein